MCIELDHGSTKRWRCLSTFMALYSRRLCEGLSWHYTYCTCKVMNILQWWIVCWGICVINRVIHICKYFQTTSKIIPFVYVGLHEYLCSLTRATLSRRYICITCQEVNIPLVTSSLFWSTYVIAGRVIQICGYSRTTSETIFALFDSCHFTNTRWEVASSE